MPMNRSAKFDVAKFILGGEIRNHTNTQKKTNSNRYQEPSSLNVA